MSKTSTALLVKFLMTLVAAVITFQFIDGNPWLAVFIIALAGTAINYMVGDLMVLPRWGNITAAIGDGLMAAVTAYIISLLWPGVAVSFTSLAIFAVLVAAAEYFFHFYLKNSEEVAP